MRLGADLAGAWNTGGDTADGREAPPSVERTDADPRAICLAVVLDDDAGEIAAGVPAKPACSKPTTACRGALSVLLAGLLVAEPFFVTSGERARGGAPAGADAHRAIAPAAASALKATASPSAGAWASARLPGNLPPTLEGIVRVARSRKERADDDMRASPERALRASAARWSGADGALTETRCLRHRRNEMRLVA